MNDSGDVLEDVFRPGLRILFCGTAAGTRSALVGEPYAGKNNKFWKTLHQIGLTPSLLSPQQYRTLVECGIGLTDLAKSASGPDSSLSKHDFSVTRFKNNIRRHKPRIVAFNGKKAAAMYLEVASRNLQYGAYAQDKGGSNIWILPSTSGAASGYWDEEPWQRIARAARED